MAKKKSSGAQTEKPLPKEQVVAVKPQQPAMDSDASDKIDSLKALNQWLLKEAVERRQQILSLEGSKVNLESEVSRLNGERDDLRLELNGLGERLARMELERAVVADFVALQVDLNGEDAGKKIEALEVEMAALRSEIGRLSGELSKAEGFLESEREVSREISLEKDGLKKQLGLQIEEIERLKAELDKSGDVKRGLDSRIEELENVYAVLGREREDLEMTVESIKREKDSMLRSLEEANRLNGELGEEIRRVVREKEFLEKEKAAEMVKREGLQNDVNGLNETVAVLEKEEEKLRSNVAILEKQCNESEERLEELRRERNDLVKEKKLGDKKLEGMIEEKIAVKKDLVEAIKRLDEQKLKIDELGDEKSVILEDKARLEGEVFALKEQVEKLKHVVSTLEEASQLDAVKIMKLESEVRDYECKLDKVISEKNEWENCAQVEKDNAVVLKGKIHDLEGNLKESVDAAEKAKARNAAILSENSELASECGVLKGKIATLESSLKDAKNEIDSVKAWAEMADAKSGQAMSMLKDVVAFCIKDSDALEDGNEEGKVSSSELEMIKRAFESKEGKVEKMARQLESVEEAHKRKGFWTMISWATTILAASVSIAYASRGH